MSQSVSKAVPRLPKAGLLILALVFAELLSAVELAMMYVALPTLMRDFDADTNAVAWVVSGYMLVAACAAALGGRLGDMYGRRRVLLIACVLAAVGSVVSLLSVTLTMLIVGRTIQGAAGAIMALAFGLAREYLPEKRKQTGISIIGAAALIGGAMGAMVAGILVQSFSWHGIFILSGVLAVVSFVAVLTIVPRDGKAVKGTRLDVLGAILLPIAVASLLLSLNFGKDFGFGSAFFLAPIAIALIVGTAWVFWELRAPSPIVNVRMLKNTQVSRVMLATLLISIGPIGGLAVPLALLQQYPAETGFGYGLTPTAVGLLTAVTALVGFAASPVGGTIAHKFGARTMFIITAIALVIGAGIILLTMGNLPLLIVALTVTTTASGMFFGALGNVLFEAVPLSHSSEVAGTAMMVRNIGQSAGTAVAAFIIGLFFVPATGGISHQGFIVAITVVTVLGAVGVAVSLFLSRRPKVWQPLVTDQAAAETELVPQRP